MAGEFQILGGVVSGNGEFVLGIGKENGIFGDFFDDSYQADTAGGDVLNAFFDFFFDGVADLVRSRIGSFLGMQRQRCVNGDECGKGNEANNENEFFHGGGENFMSLSVIYSISVVE